MSICSWDMNIFSTPSHSNLQSFLKCMTPVVPVRPKYKDPTGGKNEGGVDEVEFSIGDLWKYYETPSSYGLGVPIVVDMNDTVVQYYSPTLSAIQLFTKSSISEPTTNGENQLGNLYLQYNEKCSPYNRLPLADKIDQLALRYPGLKNFTSSDLSTYSWIAIAWYPICHIPVRRIQELAACFITYHSLSTSFPGVTREVDEIDGSSSTTQRTNGSCSNYSTAQRTNSLCSSGEGGKMSLPPFAMATYRMSTGKLWLNPTTQDQERLNAYKVAAHSWLKLLNFHHHDFTFFTSH